MDAAVEDALVEWYESERLARASGASTRHGDVIDFESARTRHSHALNRLFSVVDETVAVMSMLQPVAAVDRHDNDYVSETGHRAHA